MKNLILFLLAVYCSCSPIKAQNYPFPTADAEWISTTLAPYFPGGGCVYYYVWRDFLGADTLIQNKVYKQVLVEKECRHNSGGSNCPGFSLNFFSKHLAGAIRTEGEMVYFYKFSKSDSIMGVFEEALVRIPDTTEILLYNFNWGIGDTVQFPVKSGAPWLYTVTKKDILNGRKRITLRRNDSYNFESTVLEGVGANLGLLGLYYHSVLSTPIPLGPACFYHNGVKVVDGNYCNYCGLVGSLEPEESLSVRVYPNPATEAVRLEMAPEEGPFILQIYDLQGRLLFADHDFSGDTELLLGSWSSGGWLQIVLQTPDARARWTGRVWHSRQ